MAPLYIEYPDLGVVVRDEASEVIIIQIMKMKKKS